jgi:hypothetical protein
MNYFCKVCQQELFVYPESEPLKLWRHIDGFDVFVYQCENRCYTLWIQVKDQLACAEFISGGAGKYLHFLPLTKQAFVLLNGKRKTEIEVNGFDELTSEKVFEWQQKLKKYIIFS